MGSQLWLMQQLYNVIAVSAASYESARLQQSAALKQGLLHALASEVLVTRLFSVVVDSQHCVLCAAARGLMLALPHCRLSSFGLHVRLITTCNKVWTAS
jgi:hypothetical protein